MLLNRHVPWPTVERNRRIGDGRQDEEIVLIAPREASLLVRRATREEDLYTRTDCWVLLREGAVLGVDITTRAAGTPGWEAKRCADLIDGVVWLAIPWQRLACGVRTPQAAHASLARSAPPLPWPLPAWRRRRHRGRLRTVASLPTRRRRRRHEMKTPDNCPD